MKRKGRKKLITHHVYWDILRKNYNEYKHLGRHMVNQ